MFFLSLLNRALMKCLIVLGVPLNCSTMRTASSELRTMVTSLCVLVVAFLLIMWIYHKLNTRKQETLMS